MRPCISFLPIPLALCSFILLAPLAHARHFELKEGGAVTLEVPDGWLAAPGYLGMPLMILGPETTVAAVGRPVISVTPTHKKLSSLAATDLENGERDYQEGRKAWLARSQGRLIEFQPLRRSTLARGVEGSSIGFRYRIGARDFQEFSYTVVCAGELYHLKTLTREAQGRSIASEVEKAVRSFECK